jgi:hypothetical protein
MVQDQEIVGYDDLCIDNTCQSSNDSSRRHVTPPIIVIPNHQNPRMLSSRSHDKTVQLVKIVMIPRQ